jgi:hypothetical protein
MSPFEKALAKQKETLQRIAAIRRGLELPSPSEVSGGSRLLRLEAALDELESDAWGVCIRAEFEVPHG